MDYFASVYVSVATAGSPGGASFGMTDLNKSGASVGMGSDISGMMPIAILMVELLLLYS